MGALLASLAIKAKRAEPLAYSVVAAVVTLTVASRFYASLRLETLHALHWASPGRFDDILARGAPGPWSAPLDDVFIHFDFARSTARGSPFQWSEGNGYSSGGTSALYPFLLALGYWGGFRGLRLMEWAAITACICVFCILIGARRLVKDLPRPASYLLPFGFLSVGVLDWSLFSGMEVALFLALWMGAYLAADQLVAAAAVDAASEMRTSALVLGLCSALVTATRPEGVVAVGVLAISSWLAARRFSLRSQLGVVLRCLMPALFVVVLQSIANRVFTGESTAAGALVKLEAHHPYLARAEVVDAWLFHVKYQVLRVTQYHFADRPFYGWLAWALAFSALWFRSTRRPALILWSSALLWVLIVATNGQVRWQNERYSMPAVAWLLLAATLGTGALLTYAYRFRRRIRGALVGCATTAAVAAFVWHQAPRFREQLWFFGRASRNILDQHVQVGELLRTRVDPTPTRVLVGDAGAIPYISDLPALDIIGLGGYHRLPFARATRQHVGAAVELIERLAPSERPDLLAIYPGWWGELPLLFGRKIGEVPVRGNVICGGASKVLYRPDWSPLDPSGRPFDLRPGEVLVDTVDPADLVNEREHAYRIDGAAGYVSMKLLDAPPLKRPLWDAGRIIPPGARQSFRLSGLNPARSLRLLVRAAPTTAVSFQVALDGKTVGTIRLEASDVWVESSLEPLRVNASTADVGFLPADRERIEYHVFAVQRAD